MTRRRDRLVAPAVLAIATLLPGLALVATQRYRVGIDGISYLTLADAWTRADLTTAANAYWGPLLPLSTAPFLAAGLPPVVAGHLPVLLAAVVIPPLVLVTARRLGAGTAAAGLAGATAIPVALAAVSFGVFPDLLLAAVLAALVAVVARPDWTSDRRAVVAVGALVGLAFLAKVVGVLIGLGLVGVGVLAAEDQPLVRRARATGAALLVAAVPVLVWGGVLSAVADQPTLASSPGYTAAVLAEGSPGAPVLQGGLWEPADPDAVTAWHDPTTATRVPLDDPSGTEQAREEDVGSALPRPGSVDVLTGALARVPDTVRDVLAETGAVVPMVVGLAGAALAAVRPGARRSAGVVVAATLVALAIPLLTVVEWRYLWPAATLALPGVALGLDRLERGVPQVAIGVALVVAVAAPLVGGVALRANAGELTTATARQVAVAASPGDRVASIGRYQRSAVVCLHAGCTYLGSPAADTPAGIADELRAADVAWVFDWALGDAPPGTELVGAYGEMRLYRVVGTNES